MFALLSQETVKSPFKEPIFIMTVDVDSWSSLLKFYSVKCSPTLADIQVNIEEGVNRLLQLFNRHEIKATFFVPGEVAKRHYEVIRKVYREKHEIACHGLFHEKDEFLRSQVEQEFCLREATRIIQKSVGCSPMGFRAPCLRANATTLNILEKLGYVYDSSVVPTFAPRYYGYVFAPKTPYNPSNCFIWKRGSRRLLELPVSVNPLLPFPLSAAWMRNLGLSWVKLGMRMNFRWGNPVVFYIHPRDVTSLPKLRGIPWHLYRNTGSIGLQMLDSIINFAKDFNAVFIKAIDFVNHWTINGE